MSPRQPETVSSANDESWHEFIENEPYGDTYRRRALPEDQGLAEECGAYLECDDPQEDFPGMGWDLLNSALDKDHDIHKVTEFSVRGYGNPDEVIIFGVEYSLEEDSNSEAKAVAKSESSASPGF